MKKSRIIAVKGLKWRMPMLRLREENAPSIAHDPSEEWIRLIRKLRWIGMEEEAQRLQAAVSTLPSSDRGSVVAEPLGTD